MKQITIKPEVRFGKPCIKGTRITVADILRVMKKNCAIEDVPKQYPSISLEDAKAALRYAASVLG